MSEEKKNGFPMPDASMTPPPGFDPSKMPKDFDPSKKPQLLEITDTLKTADPARAALYTSVNQAITDDFDRKVKAYNEWKKQELDPIAKWNNDHKDQIDRKSVV